MPILKIHEYPAEILSKTATPIADEEFPRAKEYLDALIDSMFETMYASHGVGLAAPQVGVSRRIFVMDCGEKGTGKYAMINPVILEAVGEQTIEEGCLSFPGVFEKVLRFYKVRVSYYDTKGEQHSATFEGFEAIAFQHEREHLDGVLFINHLSRLKQDRAKQKLAKLRRR